MAIRTVTDPDGTVRQVNDAYAGQVGYTGWDSGQQDAMNAFQSRRGDADTTLNYYKNLMGVGPQSTYSYNPAMSPSRTDPNSTGYNQYFGAVQAGQNPFTELARNNWTAIPGQGTFPGYTPPGTAGSGGSTPPMMTSQAASKGADRSGTAYGGNQASGLGLTNGDVGYVPPDYNDPWGGYLGRGGWGVSIPIGGGGGGTSSPYPSGSTDSRTRAGTSTGTGTAGRVSQPTTTTTGGTTTETTPTDSTYNPGIINVRPRSDGGSSTRSNAGTNTNPMAWTNAIQTPSFMNTGLPANLGGGIGFTQYQNWLGAINPQLTQSYDYATGNQAYLDQMLRNSNQMGNSWNWYMDAANGATGNPSFNQYQQFGNALNPFWNSQAGNLNYLAQYGLPGNQQVQQEQVNYGNSANALLGQNGNYGLQQMLQQIMQGGLPGQSGIQNMTNEFANRASGTGLTPEFVNAMRQMVLQPTQESYQGAANRQGGGVSAVPTFDENGQMTSGGSGLFAEMARRNERDFNNQMIAQGFANIPQYANIANQSFGNVAQSAYPYVNTASNLALGLGDQSLNRFNSGSTQGLNNLSTIQQLAMAPQQQNFNNYSTLMNSYLQSLGQAQNFGLGQGQLNNQMYLGQLGPYTDLMRTALGNDYNMMLQRYVQDQLGNDAWGKIIAALANAGAAAAGGG